MPQPFTQSSYQVRFEWGPEGLARLATSDVVIVVDVLRFSSTMPDAVAAGHPITLHDALSWSANGAAVARVARDATSHVLIGGIRNAGAVARAVRELQERREERTSVAVIAAGERDSSGDLRFAVEDQLGAGAVIAALTEVGIDHSAPEAAVAAESFRALRRGLRHLLVGSGSGRELADGVASTARMTASGIRPATVAEAAEIDASDVVPTLVDGAFVAFR